jgi:hypothetical protein
MRLESSFVVLASGVVWLSLSSYPANAEEHPNTAKPAGESRASAGDAALGGLLRTQRTTVDPAVAQLEALWSELSERPLAKTAGKAGLDRAREELSRLRELIDRRADAQAIARKKQLVWAALSSSDRQMARVELATALRDALQRREQAEAQLKAATLARDASHSPLESPMRPKAEVAEPSK